jgi:hypothetical protein
LESRKYFFIPHFSLLYFVILQQVFAKTFTLRDNILNQLEMLLTCGSKELVIWHGNWEAVVTPSSLIW